MTSKRPKFTKERPPDQRHVETDWRLFLALPIPAEIQQLMARLISTLHGDDWPVRWANAEAAHLTLHFLGDTPPERAELLRLSLGATIAKHEALTLRTGELGVFPDLRRPRVLWLGLTGDVAGLESLQADTGDRLARLGFPVEQRLFHPHLTLGRVRENPPAPFSKALRTAMSDPELTSLAAEAAVSFTATEVLLIRSFMERGGARHVPLAQYPLRPR